MRELKYESLGRDEWLAACAKRKDRGMTTDKAFSCCLRAALCCAVVGAALLIAIALHGVAQDLLVAALGLVAAVAALAGIVALLLFVHSLGDHGALPGDEARISAKLQAHLRAHEDR